MWIHVLRGLAIAILGVLTLGCGVCSMFFLPTSLWEISQRGSGNYRELPLYMSIIGLLVALVCGWVVRWLWRHPPAGSASGPGTPPAP